MFCIKIVKIPTSFEDFQITSSFDEEQIRTIELIPHDIITGEIVGKYKVNQIAKKW